MSQNLPLAGLEAAPRISPETLGQLSVILKSARETTGPLSQAVATLEGQEAALARRITDIEVSPPSRTEFIAFVKGCLSQQGADWKPKPSPRASPATRRRRWTW